MSETGFVGLFWEWFNNTNALCGENCGLATQAAFHNAFNREVMSRVLIFLQLRIGIRTYTILCRCLAKNNNTKYGKDTRTLHYCSWIKLHKSLGSIKAVCWYSFLNLCVLIFPWHKISLFYWVVSETIHLSREVVLVTVVYIMLGLNIIILILWELYLPHIICDIIHLWPACSL